MQPASRVRSWAAAAARAGSSARAWARRSRRELLDRALRFRPEILVTLALLAGWALVTWGLQSVLERLLAWIGLLVHDTPMVIELPEVWKLSAGLLLLSMVGWKFLLTLAAAGLYTLTRPKDR